MRSRARFGSASLPAVARSRGIELVDLRDIGRAVPLDLDADAGRSDGKLLDPHGHVLHTRVPQQETVLSLVTQAHPRTPANALAGQPSVRDRPSDRLTRRRDARADHTQGRSATEKEDDFTRPTRRQNETQERPEAHRDEEAEKQRGTRDVVLFVGGCAGLFPLFHHHPHEPVMDRVVTRGRLEAALRE